MTRTPTGIEHDHREEVLRHDSREPSEDELIMHLERDQFVAATSEPVQPAPLSRRASALLWSLRVFVVLVSIMVLYTFVDRLH